MEKLKSLLEQKKYDEIISTCVDETSYEQLFFKALANMYKRKYDVFADFFSKALNISSDVETIDNVTGMKLGDFVSELSGVLREEIKDMLGKYEETDDINILLQLTLRTISNSDAVDKIVNTFNSYASFPAAGLVRKMWYITIVEISSDTIDFFESYLDKIYKEYEQFGSNGPANSLDDAFVMMAKLKKLQDKCKGARMGLVFAQGLLEMALKWPNGFDDEVMTQIKDTYRRLIDLQFEWIEAHKMGVSGEPVYLCDDQSRKSGVQELGKYILSFKKIEPEYQSRPLPTVKESTSAPKTTSGANSKSSGGCYVATAVYGSYDCPQVWTLRRYRDNTLANSAFGRAFVKVYYTVSPTLVKWFGETKWFSKLWRKPLDKFVGKLNDKGVENTPYEDTEW